MALFDQHKKKRLSTDIVRLFNSIGRFFMNIVNLEMLNTFVFHDDYSPDQNYPILLLIYWNADNVRTAIRSASKLVIMKAFKQLV